MRPEMERDDLPALRDDRHTNRHPRHIELDLETFVARGGHREPFHSEIVEPWLEALYAPGMEDRYETMMRGSIRHLNVNSTRWVDEGRAEIRVPLSERTRTAGELEFEWIPASVLPPAELLAMAQPRTAEPHP